MRTPSLRALPLLLLSALLVACGDSGADPGSGEDPSAADTRVVETTMGDVEVPAEIQRVVAADFYGAFTLVDLGFDPVGVVGDGYDTQPERYAGPLGAAASVGDWETLDYEAILAQEPDVIVRSVDTDQEMYDRLSEIAPTVVVSFQDKSLPEVTTALGAALGHEDEAAQVVGEFEDAAAAVAEEYADVLAAHDFALATPTGDGSWYLYGSAWTDLTVLTAAGARLAPPADTQEEQTATYSFEELGTLEEADVLLIDPSWDNAELTGNRLWQRLPAVAGGKVHEITTGTSSIGTGLELLAEFQAILDRLA